MQQNILRPKDDLDDFCNNILDRREKKSNQTRGSDAHRGNVDGKHGSVVNELLRGKQKGEEPDKSTAVRSICLGQKFVEL